MRRALVAGNWKMNGSLASVMSLMSDIVAGAADVGETEVLVCPPFVYIDVVGTQLKDSSLQLGAQNLCSEPSSGAFTGEVSGEMRADLSCEYVISGHSERRALYAETDAVLVEKFYAAKKAGLKPVYCVGEQLNEWEAGDTEAVVGGQIDALLNSEGGVAALKDAVIAYEPVWAIGTGKTATPEYAQKVHAFIRQRIASHDAAITDELRILYGGSMKPDNAVDLMAMPDIDGGLIGGASLKAEDFLKICTSAG